MLGSACPALCLACRVGHRCSGEQRLRIWMARLVGDLRCGTFLDQSAIQHHANTIRHVTHDIYVVRDEEVGESEPLLQLQQQVQNLRLNRHVQRTGRLIADHEIGFEHQGAGDRDTLTLATGELGRISSCRVRR